MRFLPIYYEHSASKTDVDTYLYELNPFQFSTRLKSWKIYLLSLYNVCVVPTWIVHLSDAFFQHLILLSSSPLLLFFLLFQFSQTFPIVCSFFKVHQLNSAVIKSPQRVGCILLIHWSSRPKIHTDFIPLSCSRYPFWKPYGEIHITYTKSTILFGDDRRKRVY